MALDINDTIDNDGGFKSSHMVFRDGVKVKYPDKNADLFFGILPALADPDDKEQYLPYRDEETGKFNRWAAPGFYYPFVNRERSILSPKTHDPNAFDPIEELIKVAKSHPDYQVIAGFGADGKKLSDAFKNPEVRLPSRTTIFCVNGIVLYNRDVPSDEVYIMQLPSTAFKGQGGEEGKKSTWGLISALNLRNRGSSDEDAVDEKYYWGDVTDPRKLVPVKLAQEKPPTGSSFKIYNITPQDEDTVKVGKAVLAKRYDLESIYHPADEKEIIDYLISTFADVPQLLKMAFATKVPGFEKLLKAANTKRSFAPEDDEDDIPMTKPVPKKAKVEEDEDDLPPVTRPKRRAPEPEVEDSDDLPPVSAPKRSFAPKVEEAKAEDTTEEYAPVTAPTRKKKAAAPEPTSLRNLIDDEED